MDSGSCPPAADARNDNIEDCSGIPFSEKDSQVIKVIKGDDKVKFLNSKSEIQNTKFEIRNNN